MIDQRGPQFVQLVNGYPARRSAGLRISARHAGQIAKSAGIVGPAGPPPLSEDFKWLYNFRR